VRSDAALLFLKYFFVVDMERIRRYVLSQMRADIARYCVFDRKDVFLEFS
jgi:hypothetical protein